MKKVNIKNIGKFINKHIIIILCIVVILLALYLLKDVILNFINNNIIENLNNDEEGIEYIYDLSGEEIEYIYDLSGEASQVGHNVGEIIRDVNDYINNNNTTLKKNISLSFYFKIGDIKSESKYTFSLLRIIDNYNDIIGIDVEHNDNDIIYITENENNINNKYPKEGSGTGSDDNPEITMEQKKELTLEKKIDNHIHILIKNDILKIIINKDKCIFNKKLGSNNIKKIEIGGRLIKINSDGSYFTNTYGANNIQISEPKIISADNVNDEIDCTVYYSKLESDTQESQKINNLPQEINNLPQEINNLPQEINNLPQEINNVQHEEHSIPQEEEHNIPQEEVPEEETEKRPNTNTHTLNRCSPIVNVSYYTNNYTNSNKTSDTDTLNNIQPSIVSDNYEQAPVSGDGISDTTSSNYIYNGSSDLYNLNDKYIDGIMNQKSDFCPVILGNANGYGEFKSLDN